MVGFIIALRCGFGVFANAGIAICSVPKEHPLIAMAQALMLALLLAGSSAFTIPSPMSHRQTALSAGRAPTFPAMAVAAPKKPLAKKPVVKKLVVKKPAPKKVVKRVVKKVVKKVVAKKPVAKRPVAKRPVAKKPVAKKVVVKKPVAKSAVRDPRFAYEAKQMAKRAASQKAANLREQQKNKIAQARKDKSKAYCDSQFSGKIGRKGAFNFRTMFLGFSVNKAKEVEKRTTRSDKYF